MTTFAKSVAAALLAPLALGAARAESASETRILVQGTHQPLSFERAIQRIAVGDPGVLRAELLNEREVLLLGVKAGRTSLMVWFGDAELQAYGFLVQRDLSALAAALADIHPGIQVEIATDRDAIILRGEVPDLTYLRAAEAAAERYLDAGTCGARAAAAPLVQAAGAAAAPAPPLVQAGSATPRGSVINLLRLTALPPRAEQRVQDSLAALGFADVRVRRLVRGPVADDAADVLVLEGGVRSQVELTRVLQVAARLFLDAGMDESDIRVVADEAGALTEAKQDGYPSGKPGFASGGFGGFGGANQGSSSGGADSAASLGNRIGANIARAKAISLGGGRILSLIEVADLPQVRVDIRIYEVNRTDLLTYAPEFSVLLGDEDLNGASGTDVTGVLGFLAEGFVHAAELSSSHAVVDIALNLLESRGIARSLSAPSLTVLSGESALFQVGGEVPIPQSFSPAFGTPAATAVTPGVFNSISFRSFGVQLGVRPLVAEDDVVTLDLVAEVAAPDEQLTTLIRDATGTDPATTAFETRSLGTSARLADGRSLLIGGLQQRKSADDASYTPFAEGIPLLGWLFQRFSVRDEDLELVVAVTPVLLRERRPDAALWLFPPARLPEPSAAR